MSEYPVQLVNDNWAWGTMGMSRGVYELPTIPVVGDKILIPHSNQEVTVTERTIIPAEAQVIVDGFTIEARVMVR